MAIYADYSATAPTRPEVLELMTKVAMDSWGNASSIHRYGERAQGWIDWAAQQVANLIGATPSEIFFTSGGTESDNLAIRGTADVYPGGGHIITTPVEHKAVENTIKFLESTGMWKVDYLPVCPGGIAKPADLMRLLRDDTKLISVIHGQSEIGTIEPVEEIGAIARERNIPFHVDGVQTTGKVSVDVHKIGCTLFALSGHKLQGPQGIGALYIAGGSKISPLMHGGSQQMGVRPGTLPAPLIAGLGLAANLAKQMIPLYEMQVKPLRDRLLEQLQQIDGVEILGNSLLGVRDRLPFHASVFLPEDSPVTGKQMVRLLSSQGIMASPGSACSSCSMAPSPVVLALGYSEEKARKGIRFSLGPDATAQDIDRITVAVMQVLVMSKSRPVGAATALRDIMNLMEKP